MILADIKILAAPHPQPATCQIPHNTCHTTPGAWSMQLNKSLDPVCRSIIGRSRVFHRKRFVEIVMLEKLNCILSKRATRPVYIWKYKDGWMPSACTGVNRNLRPYKTSLSPGILDISGWDLYMQYLWPMETSQFVEALANRRLWVCGRFR